MCPSAKKMNISKITPYKNNPRVCDAAVKEVKQSIQDYGFLQPIVVDKNNIIIVGHVRYYAALELKFLTVLVIVAKNLSQKQANAYRIADNKTSEYATWDMGILESELLGLNDFYTGFSEDEIKELFDPDFDTDELNDQGDLGKIKSQNVTCPKCGKKFDAASHGS